MKKIFTHIFIDGLNGMAIGLFSTLIIGTILQQIGDWIPGTIGSYISAIGALAVSLTGAGIGCGMAVKIGCSPLVILSSAVAGMIGSFASQILSGSITASDNIVLSNQPEPLGAYLAALFAIELGCLIAEKTQIDIILTPLVSIGSGSVIGLLAAPWISTLMHKLGNVIQWGTEQQPFFMGIIVAVLMGMFLTLPINSTAIAIMLNLHGLAAGAATVGCCANMAGFAVAGFKENKAGGLLAQGLGTSMLQLPNILKRPLIWLPALLSSAILGPVSTCILKMTNTATGSGAGILGLTGPVTAYHSMLKQHDSFTAFVIVFLLCFLLPGVLSFVISEAMRKLNFIKDGDMKLDV